MRASGRAVVCAASLVAALSVAASARAQTVVTSTIGPVSLDDPGVYPTPETIGTFNFAVPNYGSLIGLTISGQFGAGFLSPDTAAGIYTVGGVTVFTCNIGDPCWSSDSETAWSYTFTQADLVELANLNGGNLNGGDLVFAVDQTAGFDVQTDTTTLSLDFAIPEPASIALFATGLLGLGLIARRARA